MNKLAEILGFKRPLKEVLGLGPNKPVIKDELGNIKASLVPETIITGNPMFQEKTLNKKSKLLTAGLLETSILLTGGLIGNQLIKKPLKKILGLENKGLEDVLGINTQKQEKNLAEPIVQGFSGVSQVSPMIYNLIFSEASNDKDEQIAILKSIINRKERLQKQTGREYSLEEVIQIPNQYHGLTNNEYKKAESGNLDELSLSKLENIKSISDEDLIKLDLKDYDSFSKGLPSGIKDYIKIGKHYFYKALGGLRTK